MNKSRSIHTNFSSSLFNKSSTGYCYIVISIHSSSRNPVISRINTIHGRNSTDTHNRSVGSLTFKTEYVCEQCVLFFTQKEWDAFIKPPVHPSTSLHGYENTIYSWDFVTETWVDKRVFSELFKLLETTLRNYFEDKRVETWGANIKSYEKETWQNQVYEARNYINDNMFETPAIDTYLQYIENKIDKLELCKRIITNNLEFNKMTMHINAIQKNWLNKLNLVTTNLEADALFEEFHTAIVNDTLL